MGKGKKNKASGGGHGHNRDDAVDSMASTPSSEAEAEINGDGDPADAAAASPVVVERCPHVGKAVHVAGLKKSLKTAWTKVGACGPCAKEHRGANRAAGATGGATGAAGGAKEAGSSKPLDPKKPVTVWMCLRCGLQLCDSNSSSDHFSKHHEIPRSDSHCIGLNVMTWRLWCHDCRSEVKVDSYKKVREAVDFVRKVEETKGRAAGAKGSAASVPKGKAGASSPSGKAAASFKARGLTNLGNTCFFNSVMQSMSQTRALTAALEPHLQKGAPFHVPEVTVQASSSSTSGSGGCEVVEAATLQLAEAGPLSLALSSFLKEMNSFGKVGVVNPGQLFGQVCKKAPQFRGFHQQDAQELLRHLLEAVRCEETKRQKTAILRSFGLTEKTDPKSVPSATRRRLQALSRPGSYTLVDRVFGGHLVSTVVCEQCHNSSQIYEPFLDLSLPLVDEKPPRPAVSKKNKNAANLAAAAAAQGMGLDDENNNDEDEAATSGGKKLSKKEKRKNKKDRRRQQQGKAQVSSTAASENNQDCEVKEEKEEAEKEEENCVKEEDGDEEKIKKELEENEKGEEEGSPEKEDAKEEPSGEKEEETSAEREASPGGDDKDEEASEAKVEEGDKMPSLQVGGDSVADKVAAANSKSKSRASAAAAGPVDGNEEDDEDDGYSEEDEDWEWDYGEEWQEGDEKGAEEAAGKNGVKEEEEAAKEEEAPKPKEKLVSLNPLPPERLERGSSEREKSSDLTSEKDNDDEEDRKGGGSDDDSDTSNVGDVEDNVEAEGAVGVVANGGQAGDVRTNGVVGSRRSSAFSRLSLEEERLLLRSAMRSSSSWRPDPEHLDPHMEELCRKVRKLSVASVQVQSLSEANSTFATAAEELKEDDSEAAIPATNGVGGLDCEEAERLLSRLRHDWVARSLTSIAPRYRSKAGECSIYSCLTQFTAPELLTGNNKWACDKCTAAHAQKIKTGQADSSDKNDDDDEDEDSHGEEDEQNNEKKKEKKPPTIYSNASKQLLIFSPPPVLTIHLKRFQQTVFNLRKVNKHVEFPLDLDLAPFCSSTSLASPAVRPDASGSARIRYRLYGVVEHAGRLQGGHYTAYVRIRPGAATVADKYQRFFTHPLTKTDEIHFLLAEIERKCSQAAEKEEEEHKSEETTDADVGEVDDAGPSRWFYVSDSHVSEVGEERVLKSQAYLLFYERTE